MSPADAEVARPRYAVGMLVNYADHHHRPQQGKVRQINAVWRRPSSTPLITYMVGHPTYAGRRIYTAEHNIVGEVLK